eukprot:scaffold6777_cov132-Cylindrotheca_fusiformis.AAC.1
MGVARLGLLSEKEERSIIMRAVPGSYRRMLVDLQRNGSRKGRCLIRPKEMYYLMQEKYRMRNRARNITDVGPSHPTRWT